MASSVFGGVFREFSALKYVWIGCLSMIATTTCLISRAYAGTFLENDPAILEVRASAEELDAQYQKILVHGKEFYAIDDMLFPASDSKAFGGLSGTPWPNGLLYYKVDRSVTQQEKAQFDVACQDWQKGANIQCIEDASKSNATTLYAGTVNQSQVGCCGGSITLVNWNERGVVAHELGHALGMIHEQSRSDRDEYVYINSSNIQAGNAHNFEKVPNSRNLSTYDFHSIMHYGVCDFSVNPLCVYIANDPNEPGERKTIVPVLCFSTSEAEIGTHGNRSEPPTANDSAAMAAQYGAAKPLGIFQFGRAESCGVEKMSTHRKEQVCDKEKQNCGLTASSKVLSQTVTRNDSWCDDSFAAAASCPAPREMTYFNQREGARCGILQGNHVQHREYQCSCVAYQAFGACYSSAVALNLSAISEYQSSKDKTKRLLAEFATTVDAGVSTGAVQKDVLLKLDTLLTRNWPSRSYERHLNSALRQLNRKIKKKERDMKEGKSGLAITYPEVAGLFPSKGNALTAPGEKPLKSL